MVMLLEGRHLQFFVQKKLDPSCFHLVCFQMDLGLLPAHVLFLFEPDTNICKKIIKKKNLTDFEFWKPENRHFPGPKIKRDYFNG